MKTKRLDSQKDKLLKLFDETNRKIEIIQEKITELPENNTLDKEYFMGRLDTYIIMRDRIQMYLPKNYPR